MKWMAPYAGSAMGEYFLFEASTRSACTTTCRSTRTRTARCRCSSGGPGREAFPATSTSTRACSSVPASSRMSSRGLLTALPVIETQAGDVSAYIPTNVISITDGQIYLESDLFFSGVRPAINVGISVSRVGARPGKAMRRRRPPEARPLAVPRAGGVAQFGSELDQATRDALGRGERMVATLNQPQYSPWGLAEQVAAIFAGEGHLDRIAAEDVARFQDEPREHLRSEGSIYAEIADKKELSDELQAKLRAEIEKVAARFAPSETDAA